MRIDPRSALQIGPLGNSTGTPESQAQGHAQQVGQLLTKSGGTEQQGQGKKNEELEKVVEQMNEAMNVFKHSVRFEAVGHYRIVISVIDTKTGKVIDQIPPERLVKAFKSMNESLGLLFDHKA